MALGVTKVNSATNIGSGVAQASTTLTYSGAVAAGSTLAAGGFYYNDTGSSTTPAVSDSVNGAWTVQSYHSLAVDTNIQVWLAAFPNTASGTPVVTFDPSGSAFIGGFFICEVTGAAVASVDISGISNAQTSTTTPLIASGTLGQADEVIFAAFSSNYGATDTITKDATYTELVNFGDNAVSQAGEAQYKIVATTTSDQADWTLSPTNGNTIAVLLSIKQSGGAAARGLFLTPPLSGVGIGGSFFRNPLQGAHV